MEKRWGWVFLRFFYPPGRSFPALPFLSLPCRKRWFNFSPPHPSPPHCLFLTKKNLCFSTLRLRHSRVRTDGRHPLFRTAKRRTFTPPPAPPGQSPGGGLCTGGSTKLSAPVSRTSAWTSTPALRMSNVQAGEVKPLLHFTAST